ncbi:MAG: hypothetical protein PVI21_01140 [Candidatus Woesebacteria bacterium]|jgi:hypothetical protein
MTALMAAATKPRKRWYIATLARFLTMRTFAPKRRHAKYSKWYRWRYALFALCLTITATGGIPIAMTVSRDWGLDFSRLPTTKAPTLEELNTAIASAELYINSLYKPIGNNMAVQSEASGVPLKAHFTDTNQWVLLGEEVEECLETPCKPTSSINPGSFGKNTEDYAVVFSSSSQRNAFSVDVSIDWNTTSDEFSISLTPKQVKQPVELWLDEFKLTTYSDNNTKEETINISKADTTKLRMLRYTVRHATQAAYMYWLKRGNVSKADTLARFLQSNGYTAGLDMRAPLFDLSNELSDELPFDEAAYEDCDHLPQSTSLAYAYKSKVCLFRKTYLEIGARDTFLQAWQALTTLQKYRDPNYEHPKNSWWLQGSTPAEIAVHLQGQWNRTGYGVPKCTPFSCNEMSGIRTSIFGALQTELGYNYGNKNSQAFADAAAATTIRSQITNGMLYMKSGTFYRPAHTGSFLASWDGVTEDGHLRYIVPSSPALVSWVAFQITGESPIPPEYLGLIPSNSETTFDATAFLLKYRCLKYKVCN